METSVEVHYQVSTVYLYEGMAEGRFALAAVDSRHALCLACSLRWLGGLFVDGLNERLEELRADRARVSTITSPISRAFKFWLFI